jgi:hypothetical protein
MARVRLPPGSYEFQVELLGRRGGVLRRQDFADVRIEPGSKTYLCYHCVSH